MDEKLDELEQVFNRIMNIPKKFKTPSKTKEIVCNKSDNTTGDDAKDNIACTKTDADAFNKVNNELIEKYNNAIQENIYFLNSIKELRGKLEKHERTIEEYENQVHNLNEVNFMLKQKERELKHVILRLKGSIRVLCRIRPSTSRLNIRHNDTNIFINDKSFTMNHIFGQESSQKEVFHEIKPEIECIFEGYNVCIFAYGQTGSGKTYTMEGSDSDRGLIFRSFDEIERMSREMAEAGNNIRFKIKYIEIYNEVIKDLINSGIVTIIHDQNSIRMKNCHEVVTSDISEARDVIRNAMEKRSTGATQANATSSRSHAVFILKIFSEKENEKRQGSLCLIDLAGSERLSKSKAENERLKETQFINKSLSALGNVISAIKRQDKHVPFRDSKLTHLMQEYLSENSRTSMIVNIDPDNLDETVCSLRFACKVSECNLGSSNRNITKIV